jgi:hypothetical protein
MIELIVTVCLANAPQQCKDVHLIYAEAHLSPYQCALRGQPEIARWISNNPPIWNVKRWYCARAGMRGKEI